MYKVQTNNNERYWRKIIEAFNVIKLTQIMSLTLKLLIKKKLRYALRVWL